MLIILCLRCSFCPVLFKCFHVSGYIIPLTSVISQRPKRLKNILSIFEINFRMAFKPTVCITTDTHFFRCKRVSRSMRDPGLARVTWSFGCIVFPLIWLTPTLSRLLWSISNVVALAIVIIACRGRWLIKKGPVCWIANGCIVFISIATFIQWRRTYCLS